MDIEMDNKGEMRRGKVAKQRLLRNRNVVKREAYAREVRIRVSAYLRHENHQ